MLLMMIIALETCKEDFNDENSERIKRDKRQFSHWKVTGSPTY